MNPALSASYPKSNSFRQRPTSSSYADLTGISSGGISAPVLGSGVFASGAGETGGRLIVSRIETDAIYSDCGPR